ncbi:MAG TPA: ABC transporter ATP-binding protein, partial [Acidobacteriota bacterium]|nr:ABC transporter ATP-binding protein [Acidobacteriota bacterium]
TVLFSSHVLSDAEMLCDRVAILRRGRLVQTADLSAVERDRRVLRWEADVRGGAAIAVRELVSERGEERLWRFPAEATAEGILAAAAASGARIESLAPQRETLEDLFLRALAQGEERP